MADWRALGYVPDSDEEDGIHTCDQLSRSTINDGFHNIEDFERTGEDESGNWTKKTLLSDRVVSKAKAETDSRGDDERQSPASPTKVEHETMNLQGRFVAVEIGIQKPSIPPNQVLAVEEIDELQLDHYEQEPRQIEEKVLSSSEGPSLQPVNEFTSTNTASLRLFSSSPLTEPPSSAGSILETPRAEKPTLDIHNISIGPDSVGSLDPQHHPVTTDKGLHSESDSDSRRYPRDRPYRNLRRRNPIQLHPYAIEDEKYRQVLKARGIKPLRITEAQEANSVETMRNLPEAHLDGDEDSQLSLAHTAEGYHEDSRCQDGSSVANDFDRDASSPAPPRQAIWGLSPLSNPNSQSIENEFPDVHELLEGHRSHSSMKGFKRQKVYHASSAKKSKKPRWDGEDPGVAPVMASCNADSPTLNTPPSPPQLTPFESSPAARKAFRFPRGVSPPTLPTPAISSEQRPGSVFNVAETPKSSIERSTRSSSENVHDLTDHSDSPLENTQNRQLEQAQRKIRGVLPASWLKLDLKMQESKNKTYRRPRESMSPSTIQEHRGVARTITRGRLSNPASPVDVESPIVFSDDESSDEILEDFVGSSIPKHQLQRDYHSKKTKNRPRLITVDMDEVLEDNRIDAMVPAARRSKPLSNRTKGIQTKLARPIGKRPRHLKRIPNKFSQKSSSYQPRVTDRFFNSRANQPPKLSILDIIAPDKPIDALPFLRIASRTARLRGDKGRHSPTSKYIRLATNDDTNDAAQTLRNWRQGTIPQTSIPRVSRRETLNRQPFRPKSGNEQLLLPSNSPSSTSEGNRIPPSEDRPSISYIKPSADRANRKSLTNLIRHQPPKQIFVQGRMSRLSRADSRSNGVAKQGRLFSSIQNLRDPRPAGLERLERDRDRNISERALHRPLHDTASHEEHSQDSNMLLRRFLDLNLPSPLAVLQEPPISTGQKSNVSTKTVERSAARPRSRKTRPKQIDLNDSAFQHVSLSGYITTPTDENLPTNQQGKAVIGLGPFGTRYTSTFDIGLLPSGVILHASTFVGSGNFHRSLGSNKLKVMDKRRGFAILRVGQDSLECGPWTDSVSTQIGNIFDKILIGLEPCAAGSDNVVYQRLLSSQMDIIAYFSDHLYFSDGVDRISCLSRCKSLVVRLLDEIDNRPWTPYEEQNGFCLQIRTLILAFLNQLLEMCNHDLVPSAIMEELRSLVVVTSRRNLHLALKEGYSSLARCLENLQHLEACEHGIRNDFSSIEAVIVSHHVLRENADSLAPFWCIARDAIITRSLSSTVDVGTLESSWQKLFTTLPFLDFDAQGIIRTTQRFHRSNDDWPSVKLLLDPVLSLYQNDSIGHVATINSYFRALLGRCLHLINQWGWGRCQLVIGIFFDFFARNNLAFLIKEESHGSPGFLESLDQSQPLEPEPKDRSFHLFLKIVGSGLNRMRKLYSEKKMRDIVWRLMPNHGRQHPKDEAVSQRDLDALRNHHDLLCVLYWASPSSARPRVNVIRNLVHLESSHREACHISIRAWANLVRFQLSTDESVSHLAPFAEWHKSLLEQLLSQHKYARTEAEEQFKSIRFTEHDISLEHLEITITRNQQQVAAVLGDALISLEIAINTSRSLECARALMTPAVFSVFDLFDARRSQSHHAIMQALNVVQAFLKQYKLNDSARNPGSDNDDSQDYGDWSAFTETLLDDKGLPVASHQPPQVQASQLLETFHEPLKQLLSNSFGADKIPQDALLLKVTEVWVGVAQVLVRQDARSWDDYITQYGTDSWDRLRKTEQSRKFHAYYLALLVETNSEIYREHREYFLSAWLETLVERESLVKFQNRLTKALISTKAGSPVLENLPFWTEGRIGRIEITTSEFLERRLSLISTVLSNIRDSLEEAVRQRSQDSSMLRQTYKNLVKRIMAAMKNNYLELGHGSNVGDSYVGFVHRIVEFLQQYTSEICPVDRFFIDAVAFPLPTTDPTYVVGRIKSYGLRLRDSRTPKQLSVYLQSVFERTAADGQQNYLVGQLIASMADTAEDGDSGKPTLRSFIIKAIVPAYLEVSLDSSIGCFIASPLLQALQTVFHGLLGALDGTSPTSVANVVHNINAFLHFAWTSTELLLQQSDFSERLQQPHMLRLLGIIYSDINALLPVLDYIIRLAQPILCTVQCIEFFKSFAAISYTLLSEPSHEARHATIPPNFDPADTFGEDSYTDIRNFTLRELRDSLNKSWVCRDGHYFLTRGTTQREVVIETISFGDAEGEFLQEIDSFFDLLASLPAFAGSLDEEVRAWKKKKKKTSAVPPDDNFDMFWI